MPPNLWVGDRGLECPTRPPQPPPHSETTGFVSTTVGTVAFVFLKSMIHGAARFSFLLASLATLLETSLYK